MNLIKTPPPLAGYIHKHDNTSSRRKLKNLLKNAYRSGVPDQYIESHLRDLGVACGSAHILRQYLLLSAKYLKKHSFIFRMGRAALRAGALIDLYDVVAFIMYKHELPEFSAEMIARRQKISDDMIVADPDSTDTRVLLMNQIPFCKFGTEIYDFPNTGLSFGSYKKSYVP